MTTPSEPLIFVRPDAKNQSLEFFWNAPSSDGGSPITSYLLTDGTISQTIGSSQGYARLAGLTNGQSYSFTLAASNAIGLGPSAAFRSVQPGNPPSPPTNPSYTSINNSTFQISWTNPGDTGGATLLGTCLTAIPLDGGGNLVTDSNTFIQQSVIGQAASSSILTINPNSNYKVSIRAVNDPGYSPDTFYTSTLTATIVGSSASILAYARTLNSNYSSSLSPTVGGSLTINSEAVGNHDVAVFSGNTTVSSFSDATYFTSTKDTASAWCIFKGNLTINSGQTFIPTQRKLFTVIYVAGNLTLNGTISMTGRGANHSGTGDSGGFTAPVNIRIGTGTFSAVTNPQIPATGGAGGVRRSANGVNVGTSGTNGGTGGGGSGAVSFVPPTVGQSGAGAAGTCFGGGGSGASIYNVGAQSQAGDAVANGGRGGDGVGGANNQISIAGGGNPGGSGFYFDNPDSRTDGQSGTGGVVIVIVEGSLSGSGSIVANGSSGTSFGVTGSGSGGGSVNVLYGTNPSGASVLAAAGGNSGAGTARKLAIGAN